MDSASRVAAFLSGHGMRQIVRTLRTAGIDPSAGTSWITIFDAMKSDPTYAIYSPLERATIATHAAESLTISNQYESGTFDTRPKAKSLTPIPGFKTFGGKGDKYRYSIMIEFVTKKGRVVEHRPIYVTSPKLLTSAELIVEQHYATLAMFAKDSPKGSSVELTDATTVNYRILSVLRG